MGLIKQTGIGTAHLPNTAKKPAVPEPTSHAKPDAPSHPVSKDNATLSSDSQKRITECITSTDAPIWQGFPPPKHGDFEDKPGGRNHKCNGGGKISGGNARR